MVSKLCRCIDDELERDWTAEGVRTGARLLPGAKKAMFGDLIQAVEDDAYLYNLVYDVLITGNYRKYEPDAGYIKSGEKIGLIKRSESEVLREIARA